MKTAVDSSVLLDVLGADPRFGEMSRKALRSAYDAGALVACEVVWAEVRAHFPSDESFAAALRLLSVRFEPLSQDAAVTAGRFWRESRHGAKRGRQRIVSDFLIGAHALLQADTLLTRDRGFYRTCFSRLRVLDPTKS